VGVPPPRSRPERGAGGAPKAWGSHSTPAASGAAVPSPRLSAKLEQPAVGVQMIRRSQQVDQLRRATAPLILLNAPPGYGKTTLLGQWAEEDQRPFLWISLDAGDNDPVVLLMYLMRLLTDSVAFGTDVLEGPIDDQEFLRAVTLPRLGQALAQRSPPFVLVLDDTHVLHGAIWDLIARLVDEVPAGSQIVLAGRTEPDLATGRLLTHRRLVRFLARDLAMRVDETQMLARSVGVELGSNSAATLVERTEGWPASLYLAVLSLRGADPSRAVEEFTGNDRLVSEYIRDELLVPADADVRRFLLRTSILRTMSPRLCDAILHSRGSGTMLDRISRSNALLTPLGRGREWYRYHQLFADVLRAELHRAEPGTEVELHRRASRWYRDQGDAEEAIYHALAIEDQERAAEIVWSEVPTHLTVGRLATLERWLAGFDGKRLVRDPFLALTAAACALAAGRPVAQWLSTAEHAAVGSATSDKRDPQEISLAVTVFGAVMACRGAVQMERDAEEMARLAPTGGPAAALACYLRGVACDQLGDTGEAKEQLRQGALLSARSVMPATQTLCLAYLTYLACLAGDWPRMERLAAQTREILEAAGMHDFITMAPVHAGLSLAWAHQHRVEEAAGAARHAARLLAAVAPIAPWMEAHTRLVMARTHLLLGDATAARALLTEAEQAADRLPDAPELQRQLNEAWRMAQAAPLTTRLGPSSISPAELRVLRLLPSDRTLAEISDVLLVSRTTVQTQATSAYRKLGAKSRGEAVERAHLLGLITDSSDSADSSSR
jgi:LuxR family transcriptional regulator, maltose regulon positive regulatory protein